MYIELAAAGFLVGKYVYHRWIEDPPEKKRVVREIQIPRTDAGTAIPVVHGRVRVRSPVLAAHAAPFFASATHQMNLLYVLGLPFAEGRGTNRIHGMWVGDKKSTWTVIGTHNGVGGPETPISVITSGIDGGVLGTGVLEFLSGRNGQVVTNPGDTSSTAFTNLGRRMLMPYGLPSGNPNAGGFGVASDRIVGFRGMMTAFLFSNTLGQQWAIGPSSNVPAYSFEVSSYHTNHSRLGTYSRVGSDSNPVNAIYDLLCSPWSGLGIPESLIDIDNFQSRQYTLHTETHGYSRCIEDAGDADDKLMDILRQIDGVLRWNNITNKIELKLIRPDYNPTTIPHITNSNCTRVQSFALGGWSNVINSVRVVFENRAKDYVEDSVLEQNQANASSVGQNVKNPIVLQYPGVKTEVLAKYLASRELAVRSKPIMKFRAIVDRSFIRVLHGDAVKVTLSNPDIAGMIFRVADVEHGTLEDGKIALDLISDPFYVWGDETPQTLGGLADEIADDPVFSGGLT